MTAPAYGSLAAQLGLVAMLERYERAEKLAAWFPDVKPLWQEADRRHDHLFEAAMYCGYEPGGRHAHFTVLEWSTARADLIRRTLPNHVNETRRAA